MVGALLGLFTIVRVIRKYYEENETQLLSIFFGLVLLGLVGYGLYLTLGAGKKDLRDPIDEHAKMHELGIAHGHGGNKEAYEMSGKLKHTHED